MKSPLFSFFLLGILFVLAGCTTSEDVAKAEQYQLELQYYQYAVDFAGKGMTSEALGRCEQMELLRNECIISFVQIQMRQGGKIQRAHCESINPEYRINMTNRALGIVYRDIDKELADELKTKMRPTPERIAAIQSIKEQCIAEAEP
ncbi:MAG: hypothetical protein Q7S65_05380 [Nanoarchaeota archaeon]|nr:hypothetical protein [Nanoarchaeota archaeon]